MDLNPVLFGSKSQELAFEGEGRDRGLCSPSPWDMETWTKHIVPYENKTLICQGSITATPAHLIPYKQGLPSSFWRRMASSWEDSAELRLRPCSEVGRALGWLLSSLASDRPASLLPHGDAVAGADLLGVLEKASRACNDATGQPAEECVVKSGHLSGPLLGSTCMAGRAQPPVGGSITHLFPEFPVILDKGWLPRPRSSSLSSMTRLRPITSHTFEGRQRTASDSGPPCEESSPLSFPLTFSCSSSILKMARPLASAWTFPRSPRCCNETQGKGTWGTAARFWLPYN